MGRHNNDPHEQMVKNETYQGGYDALLKRTQGRTAPLEYAEGEALPALDTDFTPLLTRATVPVLPHNGSTFADKRWRLQTEFEGQPEVLALHGLIIANLRKDGFPDHTPALFQKLWAEHSAFLLKNLPLRWLVSAVMTFGDHGINEAQRQSGRSLSLLFSMMKLYEFERLYSGKAPEEAYGTEHKIGADLPLGIPAYSLKGGGLDAAVLSRLWKESGEDAVIEPLAKHLLEAINTDPGTLFRRLQVMSGERIQAIESKNNNPIPVPRAHVKRDPNKITWGVVATINEDRDQALAFAAHHLDLGADQIVLFSENEKAPPRALRKHPKIQVIQADDRVLPDELRVQMPGRNARKAFYFNRARRKLSLDWLAMLDTDEFLVPSRPLPEILADVPADAAFLTLKVVEKFAGSSDAYRPPAKDWTLPAETQDALYSTYRNDAANLMLGPSDPRLIVRAKIPDIRVGNFLVKYHKRPATNGFTPPDMLVAHNHTDSLADFLEAMPRRLDQGYTRRGFGEIAIRATLGRLDLEADSTDLEAFFDEIATARPEVLAALEKSGDLHRIDLRLEEKIKKLVQESTA